MILSACHEIVKFGATKLIIRMLQWFVLDLRPMQGREYYRGRQPGTHFCEIRGSLRMTANHCHLITVSALAKIRRGFLHSGVRLFITRSKIKKGADLCDPGEVSLVGRPRFVSTSN